MSETPTTTGAAKVKSLAKALQILKCFTPAQPDLGVTEISRMLGVQKTTVHNILSTFEHEGFVEQDPISRKYRLGLQTLYLGNVVREGLGLRKVALPIMEQARDRFRETVHLTIEQEGRVVYIESVQPPDRSVARLAVGKQAPMHCTGVGKAMLAFAPAGKVHDVIARYGLPSFTPNTITAEPELLQELDSIRACGYAIDDMEHEWGIRCIAVPVRNEQGHVCASISISGPSQRFATEDMAGKAASLMRMGNAIAAGLGWRG